MIDKDQEENAAALAKMIELGILPRFNTQVVGRALRDVQSSTPLVIDHASREPKTHELKVQTQFWADLWDFKTTAQLRQDDRQYRIGDILDLREFNPQFGFTGMNCKRRITHILRHEDVPYGVRRGWCILSTARMDERSNEDAFRAGYNAAADDYTSGGHGGGPDIDAAWTIYRDAVGTT